MSRSSLVLMESSEYKWEVIAEPLRADGWFGYSDGKHTLAISTTDLRGRVWVEASLASDPTEDDWFPIHLGDDEPFIQFPVNPNRPTGADHLGDSGVVGFSFVANVVWLRARLDRSYFIVSPNPSDMDSIAQYGIVRKILLNG